MGNCCGTIHGTSSSSAIWAGDDWEPTSPERSKEKEELLGGVKEKSSSSSTVGTRGEQVRIRISKKQLEELLRRVNESGTQRLGKLKTEQILQRMIDQSDQFVIHHQRSWRPALQSIPEVN